MFVCFTLFFTAVILYGLIVFLNLTEQVEFRAKLFTLQLQRKHTLTKGWCTMAEVLDKPVKASKATVDEKVILDNLFKQVPAVTNVLKVSVFNVFSNRFRINVWQSIDHPFFPNAGKIAASYFVSVEKDGEVTVIGKPVAFKEFN